VEVELPEKYFNRIQVGDITNVEVPAVPGKIFKAPIVAKVSLADFASRTFPVRVQVDNSKRELATGMFARVKIKTRANVEGASMMVPKDAVVLSPDRTQTVFVARETDEGLGAFPEVVKTGRVFRDKLEVIEGNISVGDKVIIRGNELIMFPGQPIAIPE
jgi:multidrug efflux pump subunit AcrA (membrane-fusion protein)